MPTADGEYSRVDLLALRPGETAYVTTQNSSKCLNFYSITATTSVGVFNRLLPEIVAGFAVISSMSIAADQATAVHAMPYDAYVSRYISVGERFIIGRDENDGAIRSPVVTTIRIS